MDGYRRSARNATESITISAFDPYYLIPVNTAYAPQSVQRSPLAKVPYHLCHAAVSLWLNAGVPATQVAEWMGDRVHVLLKVYAKRIDGKDEAARKRIGTTLSVDETSS